MKAVQTATLMVAFTLTGIASRADEVEWRPVAAGQRVADEPEAKVLPDSITPKYLPPPADKADSKASKELNTPKATESPAAKPVLPSEELRTRISRLFGGSEPPMAAATADQVPTFTLVSEHAFGEDPPPMSDGRKCYVRAELLLWWIRGQTAPPLVTTATPPNFGFLNGPTTQVLYGGGQIGGQFLLGGRFTVGGWLDDCETCGWDASYFFLGPRCDLFRADTSQFPVLTRPIFAPNPELNREVGQIVSFPPGFTQNGQPLPDAAGSVEVLSHSFLWGADVHGKKNLCCEAGCRGGYRIDLFAGFRYLDLEEELQIRENIVIGTNNQLQPPLPPATRVIVTDFFETHNQFYGIPFGLEGEWRRGRLFTTVRGSVALGVTHQTLIIDGRQAVTPPGGPTAVFAGGLLALPGANMGRYEANSFSVVPELTCNVGLQINPRWRAFVGYNFLYWNNIIRPGDQIDRVVDVTRVPNFVPPGIFTPVNPPRPAVPFRQADFWAQGLNLGLEFRW